ncbi:MAG: class I SAM-dependent RNA methyltransferase [Desulfurococcales archaeon]|nr:class I SAM-dependent RNA methyltransferase [Desulfurococcales archaeon]
MKTKYLVTCNPGLEDIAAKEITEELPSARILLRKEYKGRIIVEDEQDEYVMTRLIKLRSIHSAYILLAQDIVGKTVSDLDKIYAIVENSSIDRYIPAGASFAVRASRIGEGHEYTSMDVARITGDAIGRVYLERYGSAPLVRLNSPSITVYAEIDEDIYRLGIEITGERSLHRRGYRIYDHPAALKATLAYSMLRLIGAHDNSVVMDPMCGGGTVAIEAALLFENSKILCVDKLSKHIRGARINALAARVYNRIHFYVHDARRLEEIIPENSVDFVVSNPPYGIRMGDPTSVRRLYRDFLPSLYKIMAPDGKAGVITADSHYFAKYAREAGFKITSARKVRHGDLWATIFILEKH